LGWGGAVESGFAATISLLVPFLGLSSLEVLLRVSNVMKKTLPDFTNKLVSVSFAGADDTHAIEHTRWETQGGRLFLVGTVPRGGSTRDWVEGVVCAVAWP
jgi:hypothetical protein